VFARPGRQMENAGIMRCPHPEEPRSGVSKDGSNTALFSILRDAAKKAAPQDEASLLFDGEIPQLGTRRANHRLAVQSSPQKYFRSLLTQIICIFLVAT